MASKKLPRDRHGDVEIHHIPDCDVTGMTKLPSQGDVVLAEGEATGHAHRARGGSATLYASDGSDAMRILHVVRTTNLTHEEHGPITLEPGFYRIGIKRQYSPEDGWESVQD